MKSIIHLLVIIFCMLSAYYGYAIQNEGKNRIVKEIGALCKGTNKNLNKYKKNSVEVYDYSTEGGQITGYYDGNILVKIIAEFNGEMGKSKEEIYFKNNCVILVVSDVTEYKLPIYNKNFGRNKYKSKNRTFFYFVEEKLMKIVINKKEKRFSQDEIKKKNDEIIENITRYKNNLKNESK